MKSAIITPQVVEGGYSRPVSMRVTMQDDGSALVEFCSFLVNDESFDQFKFKLSADLSAANLKRLVTFMTSEVTK